MCPLINPIGMRLNLNLYWKYKANSDYAFDSQFIYYENINIDKYIAKFFTKNLLLWYGVVYSHASIVFKAKDLKIHLFLYEGKWLSFFGVHFNKRLNIWKGNYYIYGLQQSINFFYRKNMLKKRLSKKYVFNRFAGVYKRKKVRLFYKFIWRYVLLKKLRGFIYFFVLRKLKRDLFFLYDQKIKIKISLSLLENSVATASVITRYMVRKLKNRYSLNELIGYIKRLIVPHVQGLRIKCTGRFTRRQRASVKKVSFGRVSLNTLHYYIDYDYKPVTLKYGVGGIKIWISR